MVSWRSIGSNYWIEHSYNPVDHGFPCVRRGKRGPRSPSTSLPGSGDGAIIRKSFRHRITGPCRATQATRCVYLRARPRDGKRYIFAGLLIRENILTQLIQSSFNDETTDQASASKNESLTISRCNVRQTHVIFFPFFFSHSRH